MSTLTTAVQPQPQAAAIGKKFIEAGGHVIFFPRGTKACKENGWQERATNDLSAALQWVGEVGQDANVGIVGKQNGLWALDDDAGLLDEYVLKYGPINTYTTRTVSGGKHFIFRQNAASWAMGNVSIKNEKGAELVSARIDNRYVVAAGSWAYPHNDTSKPLTQYTAVDPKALISEAPETLLQFIKDKETEWKSKGAAGKSASTQTNGQTTVVEGGRNNYLASRAGAMRNAGVSRDSILVELLRINERDCDPPLGEPEVTSIADSYGRYPEGTARALVMNQQPDKTTNEQEPVKSIVVVKGDNFMAESIAPRKVLVRSISAGEPVIFEQSINQVFAWRGIGKTCLGLGFVRCLATAGQFLNFQCDERVPVLYVEGELPDSQFQERWKAIVGKTDGYAYMSSIDKQPEHNFTSLATKEGVEKIEATLVDLAAKGVKIKVLFLDNISTLFNIEANGEDAWIPIQSWFTSLRSRGITVFFFHHAGKAGASRSHSKSEDMLDVSIKLEAPEDPESGHLHALMTFDKARAGISERPAEIKLHRTHSNDCVCALGMGGFCPGDGVLWEFIPKADKRGEAEAMFSQGRSVSEVSKDLGISLGTVKTWRTNWAKKGKPTKLVMSGSDPIHAAGVRV
jgi:hypothetical protein